MPTPLVLYGRLVTLDPERPLIEDGALYVGADERIEEVKERSEPEPSGYEDAARLETDGAIYPGLIDLHNHVAYNALALWTPTDRREPYTTRYQWTDNRGYKPEVSDPTKALGKAAGKALLKYVETKAVVGGVTAIQGSANLGAHPYEGWLVRNVEFETFKTKKKSVYQAALPFRDESGYEKARERLEEGSAFLYHLAEGTDPRLVEEYEEIRDHGCLAKGFVGIHTNALDEAQYREWAPRGGSIVWSPFSNLWLYAKTTDVLAAREAGLNVCLGADWSPSGSKNLLGELKVADLYNATQLEGALSAEDLCRMATANPAQALGWEERLGRLRPGLHADVLVTTDRHEDPYRNLIESVERDVLFVAINGVPFYGTPALMRAARAERAEPIRVGRHRRSIVLIYPGLKDADMGWLEVLEDLRLARRAPEAARERSEAKAGGAPLELRPDKPPDLEAPEPPLAAARDGRVDSLTHDSAYFEAIDRAGIHGGQLDGLREYYRGR